MAKLYCKSGLVGGEERTEAIPLHEWCSLVSVSDAYTRYYYDFLVEQGKYHREIYQVHPELLERPLQVDPKECHNNTIFYAEQLHKNQPQVLEKVRFVSGLFSMKASKEGVPHGKEYFIGHHSFLIYDGIVVDSTVLAFPPVYYSVDQYFGVSFSIPDVIEKYKTLQKRGVNLTTGLPLEHLRLP
jgi:hypothetical protein